jgi:hypothetical protein
MACSKPTDMTITVMIEYERFERGTLCVPENGVQHFYKLLAPVSERMKDRPQV